MHFKVLQLLAIQRHRRPAIVAAGYRGNADVPAEFFNVLVFFDRHNTISFVMESPSLGICHS
jgi:hypothetical protein